jgi:hypothetical protein
VTCHNQPADARALIRGQHVKTQTERQNKEAKSSRPEVMDKMNDIFQKVKKCEHELTDTILSTPYFKAR